MPNVNSADMRQPCTLIKICDFPGEYHIYPEYLDRQALADSVDPDQMMQNMASDQGLNYLLLTQKSLGTLEGCNIDLLNFRTGQVW